MPRPPPASRIGRFVLDARYRAEAGVVGALSLLARLAIPRVRRAVGTGVGTLHWALDARHRRVARDNLRLAYGDTLSRGDVRRLVLASMRHFAQVAVETLAFERYLAGEADAHVQVEGVEHLHTALARGRGAIVVSGHLGHWELLALMLGRLGVPVANIVRPLDNPYLEPRLARLRKLSGNGVIDKHTAVRQALLHLRRGGGLDLLIDQRPKRWGIPVPFFGHDAYTAGGLARLALASGAAVVPGFLVREDDGTWRMVIEPEVTVSRTDDPTADAYRLTAACTAILEGWVRRYPEQWLWTHRRWALPVDAVAASPRSGHAQVP